MRLPTSARYAIGGDRALRDLFGIERGELTRHDREDEADEPAGDHLDARRQQGRRG